LNKTEISNTFDKFHFDISGNDSREEQLLNKHFICVALEVSQFDISGKVIKDEQFRNKPEN
jgi:hypothetical protein